MSVICRENADRACKMACVSVICRENADRAGKKACVSVICRENADKLRWEMKKEGGLTGHSL